MEVSSESHLLESLKTEDECHLNQTLWNLFDIYFDQFQRNILFTEIVVPTHQSVIDFQDITNGKYRISILTTN